MERKSKESTISQLMTGKLTISMQRAKASLTIPATLRANLL